MPTKLLLDDVEVSGKTVSISGKSGSALGKSLIQKNALTIGELANSFGFIHPEQISIGPDGSINIENVSVAEKLSNMKAQGGGGGSFFDTNCSCGGGKV